VTALVLGVLFYLALASMNPALRSGWAPALPWLPLILLSAALNALGEEGTFRAAPLSTLLPAVGPRHAIGLTAVWFGLGHYYGGFPPGVAGAIGSGLLAVLMGKAMVDTRGLGWPWFIHATIDSVIYMFLATTAG
jgi:membrane protease YdiL (CAAX protease family)